MPEAKFKEGDVVMLKSGGPQMTVEYALQNTKREFCGSYRCMWFDGNKTMREEFREVLLDIANTSLFAGAV